jgi:ADP-ribose pyrophosphatase YjhB (NUDIX family)
MGSSRDSRPGIREIFLDISDSCARLEAPTYADLARCVAEWSDDEPLSSLLAPYADARVGDMIPLRILSAVHRLALAREAPEVALYLPTSGGSPPRDAADRERLRRAFLAAIEAHRDDIAAALARVPQTNEVGRTVGLAALLRRVERGFELPVRLHEIGCSAGLSLRVDSLVAAGVVPADHVAWGPLPAIVERAGCDLDPVDATTTEGRLTLTSFIWPDHLARFERLREALDIANGIDVSLVTADALDYIRGLELQRGSTLVVWHSAMWLYLPIDARDRIRSALDDLGRQATRESPLVHIGLEPVSEERDAQHRFTLAMATWPGLDGLPAGVEVPWGTTPPSGSPVEWSIPCAGGIVRDDAGRILLIRRGKEPARGLWSIPGGRVDGDETWDAAAAREVREETGIAATCARFIGLVERDSGSGSTYVIADFAFDGAGEPHAGDDADDARWCEPADIPDLATSPGLVEALREWQCLD